MIARSNVQGATIPHSFVEEQLRLRLSDIPVHRWRNLKGAGYIFLWQVAIVPDDILMQVGEIGPERIEVVHGPLNILGIKPPLSLPESVFRSFQFDVLALNLSKLEPYVFVAKDGEPDRRVWHYLGEKAHEQLDCLENASIAKGEWAKITSRSRIDHDFELTPEELVRLEALDAQEGSSPDE